MEISDAQRVFQTSQYKSAISRGPIIALLCLGSGISEACSKVRGCFSLHKESYIPRVDYEYRLKRGKWREGNRRRKERLRWLLSLPTDRAGIECKCWGPGGVRDCRQQHQQSADWCFLFLCFNDPLHVRLTSRNSELWKLYVLCSPNGKWRCLEKRFFMWFLGEVSLEVSFSNYKSDYGIITFQLHSLWIILSKHFNTFFSVFQFSLFIFCDKNM